jgi:hypothetical protein
MEKIDRLGWAAGVSFYAYGLRIGVRTNSPEVVDRITECLPPGWEPGLSPLVDHLYSLRVGGATRDPRVRNYHLLYAGLTRLARGMDLEEVLETLAGDLETHVATYARNHLFAHAGVVGWRGRAIVLPGKTWAGKSTLVAALLRAGATYYSDDFAVLDCRGHVLPFARPLSLRNYDPGQRTVERRRCGPEEFGSRTGEGPLPVRLVAVTEHRPEGRWHARRLGPGQAMLELLDHVIPTQEEPDLVASALQKMLQHATVLKGWRGEAEEAAEALLAAVEGAGAVVARVAA